MLLLKDKFKNEDWWVGVFLIIYLFVYVDVCNVFYLINNSSLMDKFGMIIFKLFVMLKNKMIYYRYD